MDSDPQLPIVNSVALSPGTRARRWLYVPFVVIALGATIWTVNFVFVSRVVSSVLDNDPRNAGYSISSHYRSYVDPSTLILDLRAAPAAAPTDLFRGLFQSAAALSSSGRVFERVVLSRRGDTVFVMKGEDFRQLGLEFAAGQNPVYLIRTLPEKLFKPTGEPAFGHWEGGMLGVLGKQIEDATEAGRRWGVGK